jgi:hypothetical protein
MRMKKAANIEDQVRLAYFTPAPVKYNVRNPEKDHRLGKISTAKVPSALDAGARERLLVPGPGSYQTPDLRDFSLPDGGRLNRKAPQERLQLDEYPIPPPGTYGVPNDPNVPRQLYGSMGKDPRVMKFIEDELLRSRHVPAPGEHDVMDAMENVKPFCPEGGRYLDQVGRGTGYFDSAAKLADGRPGPDSYSLPGSINPTKGHGRLVWKYRSETLEDTKKIITKVVGNGENPAPGQYDVPDPQPLGQAPTLKSRTLSHSMPHPYAYNCAPDHGGKFTALAPVREQNSGDQIYGRDLKKGTRRGRPIAVADEVSSNQMPLPMAERDIEQPGDTVQWRSGGFNLMKKVRSTGSIKEKREHPAVEEMSKHYAMMSRHHGRSDKAFIPNAHRRPEVVRTHSKSAEYQKLQRKKWELGVIASEIKALTDAAVEPLDEDKLKYEATQGLMDKAKFRMRMEGLSQEQQDLVLAELPNVLLETTSPGPSQRNSPNASHAAIFIEEPLAEPFIEPLPAQQSASANAERAPSKGEEPPGTFVPEG